MPQPHEHIDLPMQVRSANFVPGTVKAEERTVEIVWSTGATVRRTEWMSGRQYDESLSLEPEHVDLSRLNSGAPLLDSHRAYSLAGMLGVVERAWIANGEGRAVVRFSKRAEVEPIFSDVQDGVLRNISVGYSVRKYEVNENKGQVPAWRAVDWTPAELSVVPVGADPGAGFRSEPAKTSCQFIRTKGAEMPEITPPEGTEPISAAETSQQRQEATQRGAKMPNPTTEPKSDATTGGAQHARAETPKQSTPSIDPDAMARAAEAAVVAERQRTTAIYDAQEKLGVSRSMADQLVRAGTSVDEARRSLIDEAAKKSVHIRNHVATAGEQDERTTRRQAVESALLHRFAPSSYELIDAAREWRGMSLLEISRALLEAGGHQVRGFTRHELATRSLHTDSDFPNILANVAGKTLRNAYDTAPRTFLPFCRRVTASDFKAVTRVQLGEAPQLEKVNEGGEFKQGTMGEGKESYRLETFGKIIPISRQVIINDDLGAFTRIPQLFGVAAANLESDVVWGIIISNPTMGDGIALFHANHKNLIASGTVINVANLGIGRKNMGLQTGIDGQTVLNVRPAYILVPAALEVTAEQLLAVNMVPAKSTDVVPQSLRTLSVIAEPRLDANSTTAWYLAASPGNIDTIEYSYLEGNDGVYIETRTGFEVDGLEIKARLDFGAKAIDHRGFHKNPGA